MGHPFREIPSAGPPRGHGGHLLDGASGWRCQILVLARRRRTAGRDRRAAPAETVSRRAAAPAREEWATRRERGSLTLIALIVWITLRLGRSAARLLLAPACAYFYFCAPKARAASRAWLTRALGRPPAPADGWRHIWCFASCVLDRVLLLNDRTDLFEISLHGADVLAGVRARHGGGFLFGAHIGSFEVMRTMARALGDTRVTLVMYEDNARKTNQVLNAINPALGIEIIGLGRPGSMIAVKERLEAGHLVGILADRALDGERTLSLPFFGEPARFPVGPFRLAAILQRPIVFMAGLYRGGARYDIHFEVIAEPDAVSGEPSDQAIERTMRRYVARLEHYCRVAPYNWFNFYDFWG
jgi:predicted LPLAT superfamily acyltransferase